MIRIDFLMPNALVSLGCKYPRQPISSPKEKMNIMISMIGAQEFRVIYPTYWGTVKWAAPLARNSAEGRSTMPNAQAPRKPTVIGTIDRSAAAYHFSPPILAMPSSFKASFRPGRTMSSNMTVIRGASWLMATKAVIFDKLASSVSNSTRMLKAAPEKANDLFIGNSFLSGCVGPIVEDDYQEFIKTLDLDRNFFRIPFSGFLEFGKFSNMVWLPAVRPVLQ
ncbi:hypothetical protein CM49_03404 [Paenibacillus sp. P1XP2]|nr:hypothetical protein CM49_03404 [Paenibacillus sp. P1XP2]